MMEAAAEAVANHSQRPLLIGVTILTSMEQGDLNELGLTAPIADWASRWAALAQQSGLDGVVCSPHEDATLRRQRGSEFVLVTPGIRPNPGGNQDDQRRIMPPAQALADGSSYYQTSTYKGYNGEIKLLIGIADNGKSDDTSGLVSFAWAGNRIGNAALITGEPLEGLFYSADGAQIESAELTGAAGLSCEVEGNIVKIGAVKDGVYKDVRVKVRTSDGKEIRNRLCTEKRQQHFAAPAPCIF